MGHSLLSKPNLNCSGLLISSRDISHALIFITLHKTSNIPNKRPNQSGVKSSCQFSQSIHLSSPIWPIIGGLTRVPNRGRRVVPSDGKGHLRSR